MVYFQFKNFFFFYIFAAEECHEVAELIFNSNNNTNNAPKSATTGPLDFWRRKHKKKWMSVMARAFEGFYSFKKKSLKFHLGSLYFIYY